MRRWRRDRAAAVFALNRGSVAGSASRTPAVVLGLGVNGLGVVRSLGRGGVPVVGVYQRAAEAGRWSRYCRAIKFPAPDAPKRAFLDRLLHLGSVVERPALFPTSDEYLQFVSHYRDELATRFRFVIPDPKLLDLILSKNGTQELAERHGIAIPEARYPRHDEDVDRICDELAFPCLIKPLDTFTIAFPQQAKNRVVNAPEELRAFYGRHPGCLGQTIVQRIVRGGDGYIFVCAAYLDACSRPLGVYTGRKIRQYPPDYGITCLGESVYVPEVERLTVDFLRRIGYRGLVGVEYAQDRSSGRLFLLEINARSSYYNRLPTDCGVDLHTIAYRDWLGQASPSPPTQREGICWLDFRHDLSSSRLKCQRGQMTWGEWLITVLRARSFAYYDSSDLKPFCYAWVRLAAAVCQAACSRSRGREPAI